MNELHHLYPRPITHSLLEERSVFFHFSEAYPSIKTWDGCVTLTQKRTALPQADFWFLPTLKYRHIKKAFLTIILHYWRTWQRLSLCLALSGHLEYKWRQYIAQIHKSTELLPLHYPVLVVICNKISFLAIVHRHRLLESPVRQLGAVQPTTCNITWISYMESNEGKKG